MEDIQNQLEQSTIHVVKRIRTDKQKEDRKIQRKKHELEMDPEEKQRRLEKHRTYYTNMSDEQKEAHNLHRRVRQPAVAAQAYAARSAEQTEQYAVNRDEATENLTEERRAEIRQLSANRSAVYRSLHTATFKIIEQKWDYDNPCEFCGCQWLKSTPKPARHLCCKHGKLLTLETFPTLLPLPDIFKCLYMERTRHFSPNSAMYNKIFSIAAIGIDNGRDGKYELIMGDSCVTLNGQIYSYIPKTKDSNKMSGGLSYFTFDSGLAALTDHANYLNNVMTGADPANPRVITAFLQAMYNEFKLDYKYAAELSNYGDRFRQYLPRDLDNTTPAGRAAIAEVMSTQFSQRMNEVSSPFQVGGITNENNNANISIQFHVSNTHKSRVDGTSPIVEPLCYPLLFPYGERGWGADIRKDVSFMDYLACRMLQPDRVYADQCELSDILADPTCMPPERGPLIPMAKWNASGTEEITTNRFQLLSRLSSYYIVEEMSRAIDYKIRWHQYKKNQDLIFGLEDNSHHTTAETEDDNPTEDTAGGDLPPLDEERREDAKNFLADSFFGSPRHLKKQAQNALTAVSATGRHTLFITLTCNTEWPEIQERLFDGQSAYEREDVVCMVFKARLEAFVYNLRHGKYFEGAMVTFIIYVIEYQHRGLPHAHIACRMTNAPDHKRPAECVAYIDQFISAELPDELMDKDYHDMVKTKMLHKCSVACIRNGICKYGYTAPFTVRETSLDDKGYPLYRRRQEKDLKVVAHNRGVIMDWAGHACVEYAGSLYSVMYLFKYMTKGNAKVRVTLDNTADVGKGDEIMLYLRGRMLCSMECTWRAFAYQTYPASWPSVRLIKPKLPSAVAVIQKHEQACDMSVYFNRPNGFGFADLKYTEFFTLYDSSYKIPARFGQVDRDLIHPADGLFKLHVPGTLSPIWLYTRLKPQDSICRMSNIWVQSGEIWYLRLILLKFACDNYKDALSWMGIEYPTFQHSAIARRLFSGENEAMISFTESVKYCTPRMLRSLFVMLTLQGFNALCILDNPQLRNAMLVDYYVANNKSHDLADVLLINDLNERFKSEDKDPLDYGIPLAQSVTTELDKERLLYNVSEQGRLLRELHEEIPNTEEQHDLFTTVCAQLDILKYDLNRPDEMLFEVGPEDGGNERPQYGIPDRDAQLYFIQGQGGSGKTTFAKKVLAYARSIGLIAKGCSATGLSCQVYENFMTAHSLFGIPVKDDVDNYDHEAVLVSKIKPERQQLLDHTSLIIWDEFLSNHKQCFQCAYDITNEFKNKIVICMGDCRQIAPVVIKGKIADIIRASMISSPLWPLFQRKLFTKNMRLFGLNELIASSETDQEENFQYLHEQEEYAKMLLEIGEGRASDERVNLIDEEPETGSTLIRLPLIEPIMDQDTALAFIYPHGFDHETMHKSSILASTNEEGDNWNSIVQDMNPEELTEYLSADVFDACDDPDGFVQEMMSTEALNAFTKNGVPAHQLLLKVNDICIILRTINKGDGLSTNTRVRITHLGQFCIKVVTLDDKPKAHMISRMRFNFKIPFGYDFTMTRTQFPLRLAYCMTFNKAQGQEWDRVLADIRKPPFTHGHLYVVLSRIRNSRNIRLFCNEDQVEQGHPCTVNVVYDSLKVEL